MSHRFVPRALIFDMDGLLVDSEPLWFEVEADFVRSRGPFSWTHEQWRACIGRGTAFTLASMADAFGFSVDLAADAEAIHDLFVAGVRRLEAKPGSVELIEVSHPKLPLALASSSPSRLVNAVLDRFEIASRFGAIVTGSDVAHPKPAPDIFLEAARRLGVEPIDCLVLEDSLAGVAAARAAGMSVIAVPEGDPDGRGFEAVAHAVERDLFGARALIELG